MWTLTICNHVFFGSRCWRKIKLHWVHDHVIPWVPFNHQEYISPCSPLHLAAIIILALFVYSPCQLLQGNNSFIHSKLNAGKGSNNASSHCVSQHTKLFPASLRKKPWLREQQEWPRTSHWTGHTPAPRVGGWLCPCCPFCTHCFPLKPLDAL